MIYLARWLSIDTRREACLLAINFLPPVFLTLVPTYGS